LYFLACGRRLDWGYVDQPPLIALVSRLAWALSGGLLALYRLPAALAHGAAVFLAGRFAERLGGGAILASICVALAPIYAVQGHLLTMNAFEPLLYLGTVMLVARILRGGDHRLWIGVGALTGLALLNKLSFLFYGRVPAPCAGADPRPPPPRLARLRCRAAGRRSHRDAATRYLAVCARDFPWWSCSRRRNGRTRPGASVSSWCSKSWS